MASEILRQSSAVKCDINASIYSEAEEAMWNSWRCLFI